jgi:hypothetical protein
MNRMKIKFTIHATTSAHVKVPSNLRKAFQDYYAGFDPSLNLEDGIEVLNVDDLLDSVKDSGQARLADFNKATWEQCGSSDSYFFV